MRLRNTYIRQKEVTNDKKQLVLQRQKWHDDVKPYSSTSSVWNLLEHHLELTY
ncbi:unnamed protein product [Prunus brigantina]